MAINAKRLLKLADYLETVPRKAFSMSKWGWGEENECGFSGCALGWGVHGRLFRGVSIHPDPCQKNRLVYKNKTHLDAAALLFGITEDAAECLFGPHLSGGPRTASTRIRKFVRANSASAP